MIADAIRGFVDVVTRRSKLTIAVMLVLTVVMVVGAGGLADPATSQLGEESVEQEKLDYINEHYGTTPEEVATVQVYVRDPGGNVLSRESMLATLQYQQRVLEPDAVASIAKQPVPVLDISNRVAVRLADDPNPDLDAQITALQNADEETVEGTVRAVLSENPDAQQLLPRTYEPGTATAEARVMLFLLDGSQGDTFAPTGPVADAQQVIYDESTTQATDEYFMLSGPALQEVNSKAVSDTLTLIGPIALVLILIALTFAYRDVADILVGMFGVVITLVWMFGLIGWLNVPFGQAVIIAPILLTLWVRYGGWEPPTTDAQPTNSPDTEPAADGGAARQEIETDQQ